MILSIISFVALITSTISLLPQIYHTYRSKSVEGLSMMMLINFLICSLSWIAYGCLTNARSVWITNCIMTLFSCVLIAFKIKFTAKVKQL